MLRRYAKRTSFRPVRLNFFDKGVVSDDSAWNGGAAMTKDIRKLCKELRAQGFEVRTTRRGHLLVRRDGVVVAGIAGTPSDHRSV